MECPFNLEEILNNNQKTKEVFDFFSCVSIGVLIVKNSLIEKASLIALELLNSKEEHIMGKTLYDINPQLNFADSLTKEHSHADFVKIQGTPIYIVNFPFNIDNSIYEVIILQEGLSIEAISKKLNSYASIKQEVSALMESTPDVLYLTDKNGYLLSINSVFEETYELKQEDVIGKNVQKLFEDGLFPENIILMAIEQKKSITLTQEIKDKTFLVSAYPLFDSQGNIDLVVGKARDMSELTKVKDELENAKMITSNYYNELKVLRNRYSRPKEIIGQSEEMKRVIDLAQRVAQVDTTVVINGESGTGKEVIAKLIHNKSLRSKGPFIKINCGAIPENLLESELFGYEKGAFTGALQAGKPGLFEIATGGSLLLDEIGDMPLALQVKLLRVLQEQEFYRIGSVKPIKVDTRIIATTHRDLKKLVSEDKFREDLYYRLNVVQIMIPPLRERKIDIIPLVYFFLQKYNEKYCFTKTINADVIGILSDLNWPGNVRELENTIERLVVLSSDNTITKESLPINILAKFNVEAHHLKVNGSLEKNVYEYEKSLILKAMKDNNNNIQKAADILGVHRTTVLRKMQKYREEV